MQARTAPDAPVPEVIESVTESEAPATRLPPASRTSTTGWTAHPVPPVPPPGLVVNTRVAAGPTATVNGTLVTPARPEADAASPYPAPARSVLQPAKVAIPPEAALAWPPVQARVAPVVPVPGTSASETEVVAPVTRFPYASTTRTTGWTDHATPPVPPPGWIASRSEAAAAGVTVNAVLTAPASPGAEAARVYPAPVRSIVQPANVAPPATAAAAGPPVQARVPPPALVPIASVTVSVAPATGLPPASVTATAGCAAQAVPATPPPGCIVSTSFAAGPTATANGVEVAAARPDPVALSVYPDPARSIVQPANVTSPATAAFASPPGHESPAPADPVPAVIARVTTVVAVVGLPPASSSRTTGWVAHAVPPVPPPGGTVNTACDAVPTATLNAGVVADARPVAEAVRV